MNSPRLDSVQAGRPFWLWHLVAIVMPTYIGWIAWVLCFDLTASLVPNLFMTLTMILGSFVAGATAEGGGAVAFPVMTLIYDIPPSVALSYCLAIQSIGMTAASLAIFKHRTKVQFAALLPAGIGGAVGMMVGALWIAPSIAGAYAKVLFASLWLSFGLVHWRMNRGRPTRTVKLQGLLWADYALFVGIGLIGGLISSIVGSGVDILLFSALTLKYNLDEKVATPTTVVLMAGVSVTGTAVHLAIIQDIGRQVTEYLAATIPVVVVGAPLGARYIRRVSRYAIVRLLYFVLVIQYIGTLYSIRLNLFPLLFSLLVLVLGFIVFVKLGAR